MSPVGNNLWRKFKGRKFSVEQVSWNDAKQASCGGGMRLPTEAEWEKSARGGGAGTRYDDLDATAWYDRNSEQDARAARNRPTGTAYTTRWATSGSGLRTGMGAYGGRRDRSARSANR